MPRAPLHDEDEGIDLHVNQRGDGKSPATKVTPLYHHEEPVDHLFALSPYVLFFCAIFTVVFLVSDKKGLIADVKDRNEVKDCDGDGGKHELGVVCLVENFEFACE